MEVGSYDATSNCIGTKGSVGLLMIINIVIAGCLLLIAGMAVKKNRTLPSALGVKEGMLAPLPSSPNAVSSQTMQDNRYVPPLPYAGDLEQTKALVKKAASDFGGAHIMVERPDYLHMVFTIPVIPFKDDVEFYFSEKEQLVHYRSASRVGYSDLGVNRQRYERLRRIFEEYAK